MESVRCNDHRECFAKLNGKCMILTESYKDGKCPFYKSKEEYERGRESGQDKCRP